MHEKNVDSIHYMEEYYIVCIVMIRSNGCYRTLVLMLLLKLSWPMGNLKIMLFGNRMFSFSQAGESTRGDFNSHTYTEVYTFFGPLTTLMYEKQSRTLELKRFLLINSLISIEKTILLNNFNTERKMNSVSTFLKNVFKKKIVLVLIKILDEMSNSSSSLKHIKLKKKN